jgi:hypothetical protein
LHHHEGSLQDRRHPRDELAGVAPIGPEPFRSRQAGDAWPEPLLGPITVLEPRSMPEADEEQPEDIDAEVALVPAAARAAVRAPAPPCAGVCPV